MEKKIIETNCIVDKGHLQLQKNYVLSFKMTEFDVYDILCKLFFFSKDGAVNWYGVSNTAIKKSSF